MSKLCHAALCASLALVAATAAPCLAQSYPTKAIRVVVGPGTDLVPRLIGPKLAAVWGQQLVIDQRPGGGGAIAADIVAKAAADGHTWLLSTAVFTINAGMYAKPPYDLVRDFAPVTLLGTAMFFLLVHPSLPARSVTDLIQLAREKPGQLNYSSSGVGTPPHLAGEILKSMARIDIVHVPYKSAAASITDLLGGQVQMSFQFTPTALPHVRSGKLKALGVSGAKRSGSAPELPTIAESGLPGFEVIGWNGVHVPKGTPKAIVSRINTEILQVLKQPDIQERMSVAGLDAFGNTPEAFATFVKADLARWAQVIREARIQPE
jgi:tripartite-type tricarboxylate transporter receptor subunit TctC